jgi:uncharacterized heparinase superfamily protein
MNDSGPSRKWRNPDKSHLWLYNLHYFDDLNAVNAIDRVDIHRQLLANWLEANPVGQGVGWEPYPTSLRIVNWVKWLLVGNEAVPDMEESLFQQAHWLSQQLEYHLLGNHLLANAKALVFAGSYFEGDEVEGWLRIGLDLIDAHHREQILSDGAHFELSPMYHSIILMDVLDLIQLGICYPAGLLGAERAVLHQRAAAMANWLEAMLHPDGGIPFFNDSAFGIAPDPADILDYAHKLGVVRPVADGVTQHHDASGFVTVRRHDQVAIIDVGMIGPDYIPGHAHADTLSFEWSLFDHRVFVNSGISEYGVSEERLRQRGTSAHNTVVVNGENSSEVWSGFRVARRARPFNVQIGQGGDYTIVQGAHDGYHRLRPKVTHHREWCISPGLLEVVDTLEGRARAAVAYFHIHPNVGARIEDDKVVLELPGGNSCQVDVEGGDIAVEDSSWHPKFGLVQPNQRLAVTFTGSSLRTSISY